MKRLFRLTKETGIWAPALVLMMHEFLRMPGWRQQIDWLNHYCGGLSISFFAWKTLPMLYRWTGELKPTGRLAVTFLCGCTAALLWEIGEFGMGVMFNVHIQKSLTETMMDIVNGFLGTLTVTSAAALWFRKPV